MVATHHLLWHQETLHFDHKECLLSSIWSQNIYKLGPQTTLTEWSLWWRYTVVFFVRYEQNLIINFDHCQTSNDWLLIIQIFEQEALTTHWGFIFLKNPVNGKKWVWAKITVNLHLKTPLLFNCCLLQSTYHACSRIFVLRLLTFAVACFIEVRK